MSNFLTWTLIYGVKALFLVMVAGLGIFLGKSLRAMKVKKQNKQEAQ